MRLHRGETGLSELIERYDAAAAEGIQPAITAAADVLKLRRPTSHLRYDVDWLGIRQVNCICFASSSRAQAPLALM